MSRYSKHDYELVAKQLFKARSLFDVADERLVVVAAVLTVLITKFSDDFRHDNPSFDVERFHAAAVGVKVPSRKRR